MSRGKANAALPQLGCLMRARRASRRAELARATLCVLLSLTVAACSTVAPSGEPAGAPTARDDMPLPAQNLSPNPAFERKQRERAQLLARQGRLGEAVLAWEVVTVRRSTASAWPICAASSTPR
jgi:hypothetical protein